MGAPDTGWAAAGGQPDADAPTPYMHASDAPQQPNTPSTPGAPAQPLATTGQKAPGQIAPQDAPQYVSPPVVTSLNRGGILGFTDKILDAMTGRTRPELGKDDQGNTYVKQQVLGRGERWARVGAGLAAGAAKGFAAGRGNNLGAAVGAGFDQGAKMRQDQQQQQTDMSEEARKQTLQNANNQMINMKRVEQAWDAAQLKVKANREQINFENTEIDRLTKPISEGGPGGVRLPMVAHLWDLGPVLKVQPDVIEKMFKTHQIEPRTVHNEDGTVAGFVPIMMPRDYRMQIVPAGADGVMFNPTKGPDGGYDHYNYSDPQLQGHIDADKKTAGNDWLEFQNKKALLKQKQQETATAAAEASKVPSEIAKNYAGAAKDAEDVKTAKGKEAQAGDPTLVDSIGKGKMVPERMTYLLARNPQLLDAVTAKYPDFSSSKAEQYPSVYKEFTSTKKGTAGGALNAGATAIGHLQELQAMNTVKSHIPGTADYNAYKNKLDTLAPELATFYGDTTIPAIDALKSTLGATLPGNRDAAIRTQVQSMGDKFDNYEQQWRNAAPSASFEDPLPNVSEKTKDARASLDPKYRQRLVDERQGVPAGKVAAYQGTKLVGYADDNKGTNYKALP